LEKRLSFYVKPKLLIVDELGYLPFETNAVHLFLQLVSRCYERGSLLLTSNRPNGGWGTVFGDPVVTGCARSGVPDCSPRRRDLLEPARHSVSEEIQGNHADGTQTRGTASADRRGTPDSVSRAT
jgi:hypothetical protein